MRKMDKSILVDIRGIRKNSKGIEEGGEESEN